MKRARAWWHVALSACASVASPRADIDADDREIAAIWRASRLGAWLALAARRLDAAWIDSRTRKVVRWIAG